VPVASLRKTQGVDDNTGPHLWYQRAGDAVIRAHQQWLAQHAPGRRWTVAPRPVRRQQAGWRDGSVERVDGADGVAHCAGAAAAGTLHVVGRIVDVVVTGGGRFDDRIGADGDRAAASHAEHLGEPPAGADRDLIGRQGVAAAGVDPCTRRPADASGDGEPAMGAVHLEVLLDLCADDGTAAESTADAVDLAVVVAGGVVVRREVGIRTDPVALGGPDRGPGLVGESGRELAVGSRSCTGAQAVAVGADGAARLRVGFHADVPGGVDPETAGAGQVLVDPCLEAAPGAEGSGHVAVRISAALHADAVVRAGVDVQVAGLVLDLATRQQILLPVEGVSQLLVPVPGAAAAVAIAPVEALRAAAAVAGEPLAEARTAGHAGQDREAWTCREAGHAGSDREAGDR